MFPLPWPPSQLLARPYALREIDFSTAGSVPTAGRRRRRRCRRRHGELATMFSQGDSVTVSRISSRARMIIVPEKKYRRARDLFLYLSSYILDATSAPDT